MIATATGRQGRLQRHRIIERPRLTGLLEESKARVLVFVAPAGFGKTTLADQWIASGGRSGAWFRARRSSTDVAALALDIARACTSVVPGCDERLREHLRAVPAAGENVEVLAEILSEELSAWPRTAWLVIDEYHEIAGAEPAERFVEAVIDGCSVQTVIASRAQPSWATQRLILQGELFELTHDDLAMRQSEVAEVLGDRGAPSSALLTLAGGWPAAIGLASVSLADPSQVTERDTAHESLYRFFAEEIFATFEPSVRDGLVTLSIAPVIDRQLAAELLGAEVGDAVCAAALSVGIMVERGTQLELHPLARSFLDERADRVAAAVRSVAEKCVAHYRPRSDWDAALEVITRHALREELVPTLEAGLDGLLETARISTIEEWCKSAARLEVESPWISLARAEIALRQARFTEAQTHAEAAAVEESDVTFRALCVAGRAAHMASREEEAVELYRRAHGFAATDAGRRDAQWGEARCLIDLEATEAPEVLTMLRSSRVSSDPVDRVRSACTTLAYQLKFGPLDLAEADDAYELLDAVKDPMLQTSFLSIYGGNLAASARYDDACAVSKLLIELARRLRVDFALPFAHCTAAAAHAGRRRWDDAEQHVATALDVSRRTRSAYAEQIAISEAIRVLLQQGKHDKALALPTPEHNHSLPAGTAEVLASRALALACGSRLEEARAMLDESAGMSSAFEPKLLAYAAKAVIALKDKSPDAVDRARELASESINSRAFDILVTAYRSVPGLLRIMLSDEPSRNEVAKLVDRVGDGDLAQAVDRPVRPNDPRKLLSKREREVLALLEQGLSNRQVAQTLFLSEATIKVHAHRIYDKLGIRSRQEIAYQALLRRTDQATSAMVETDDGTDSPAL